MCASWKELRYWLDYWTMLWIITLSCSVKCAVILLPRMYFVVLIQHIEGNLCADCPLLEHYVSNQIQIFSLCPKDDWQNNTFFYISKAFIHNLWSIVSTFRPVEQLIEMLSGQWEVIKINHLWGEYWIAVSGFTWAYKKSHKWHFDSPVFSYLFRKTVNHSDFISGTL